MGAFAALVFFALLVLADFTIAGNGSPDPLERARWVWDRGDHLHYAVHIAEARILDFCPCTRRAAATQYFRAHFHAVTPRQREVAANTRPATPSAWISYVFGPGAVGLEWAGDAITWLSGKRPPGEVVVDLDGYAAQPAEIHILRGTTVTWRNVDEQGESHTVTSDPRQLASFDSAWLEPDEKFEYTFTERGQYMYYCRAHGEPGLKGMSGVVVVN
jgi:plastocyanin